MTSDPSAPSVLAGSEQPVQTRLDPASGHVTLINTYSVDPARIEDLISFLTRATLSTIRHMPGFVSANLHVSLDRTKVVNYAQWKDPSVIAAAREDPEVAALMAEQLRIAQDFSPVPYRLRMSISAPDET